MNQITKEKIVDFSKCKDCDNYEHSKTGDKYDDRCHQCLEEPVNTESTTPINFKAK